MDRIKNWLKEYWLFVLLCAQPILDVLAFWTRSTSGTAAGVIRLAVMVALCLLVMVKIKNYRRFIPSAAAVALVFLLHVFSCAKNGYQNFMSDTRMILSMIYLPVMAVCFCCLIDSEKLRTQAEKAVIINFVLESFVVLLSVVTKTCTPTYPEGIGVSGWVIPDNRCCHSDILSSLCVFAGYLAVISKKKWINIAVPAILFVLLITNGTTVSYVTLLAVCAGYPVFLLIRSLIRREKQDSSQRIVSVVMALLFVLSIVIFPWTPRYKMDEIKRSTFDEREERFAAEMDALGYNVYEMTLDDIFSDEVAHQRFIDYYKTFVYGEVDILGRRYPFDRIISAYKGTVNADILGDTRDMKNVYVRFIFEDSDLLTRMFGIEYDSIGKDKVNDLENDWFAILFYLGYFGFALAVAAVLYFLYRIIRLLTRDFRGALTDLNFALLLGFAMQLGMAYFSGAVMRRPNASIYVALYMAIIFFNTCKTGVPAGMKAAEDES